MAAVPVGYEAFQSKRRKAVTLVCFVLASAMVMGVTVYVDSSSVHEWNILTNVGDGPISISGQGIESIVNDVKAFPEIDRLSTLVRSHGVIRKEVDTMTWEADGSVIGLADDFSDVFPNYFEIEGRLPSNQNEIALNLERVQWMEIDIGDFINYTENYGEWATLEVVGIFSTQLDSNTYAYYEFLNTLAVLNSNLIGSNYDEMNIIADIDRNTISPFNAQGALSYLLEIHQEIFRLDPNYDESRPWSSRYNVIDSLYDGVARYISWQMGTRFAQLTRSGSIALLVVLVAIMSIRYNIQDRRFEHTILQARGATKGQLNSTVNREVLLISFLATVVGLGMGVMASRFAIATDGFFNVNIVKIFTEPLLISIESLLISLIVGIVLPLAALLAYRNVVSTKESAEGTGRIATLARGLRFIRWDIVIIILGILMLIGLYSIGYIILFIPFMSIIITLLPLAIFLGIASIAIKVLRKGSYVLSRIFQKIIGQIPAYVGIRKIGKEASSAGVVAAVLVLAISLAWSSAIVDVSLPNTELRQSRYGIGGDITMELEQSEQELWYDLQQNLTTKQGVVNTAIVSVVELQVAQYSTINFLAADQEYLGIGYDYTGEHYSNSTQSSMYSELRTHPDSVIISSDVAQLFELEVGSVLQSVYETWNDTIVIPFRVAGIVSGITDFTLLPGSPNYWWGRQVGAETAFADRDYIASFINVTNLGTHYLCASLTSSTNGTKVMDELISAGALDAIQGNHYSSTFTIVEEYVSATSYQMDRSVDTMLLITLIGTMFGAFTVYSTENIRARRREIALLQSLGATNRTIMAIQIAEMTVLTLVSFVLLLAFCPILISNVLITSGWAYQSQIRTFPIEVFPVIPTITLIGILLLFTIFALIFISVAAYLIARINLAQSLNASWTEIGPVGGEI